MKVGSHSYPSPGLIGEAEIARPVVLMIVMQPVSLPADFVVWAASPEAEFLQGKLVWSNWDVKELMARAKEIQEGNEMTLGLLGWPYLDYTSKMEGVVRKYGPAVTNGH